MRCPFTIGLYMGIAAAALSPGEDPPGPPSGVDIDLWQQGWWSGQGWVFGLRMQQEEVPPVVVLQDPFGRK